MKNYKTILTGSETRTKLKKGVDAVADVVKNTLGNVGRNVIIERKGRTPQITNDGVSVAKQIILKDEIEDLGAQSTIEVAMKTNDMVGDGTTTSIVLTQAIVNEAMKKINDEETLVRGNVNVMDIYKEIHDSCTKVVEELKKSAEVIKEKKDIEKIAVISLENEELGKIVADMIYEVGVNGFVGVEEGFKTETEYETINGMKFVASYLSEALATNNRKEAIFEDAPIFITDNKIDSIEDLKKLVDITSKVLKKQKLVIISSGYDKSVIPTIILTTMRTPFKILAIKASTSTPEQLEDVAVYTNATFFDKEQSSSIDKIQPEDFGKAQKVVVDKDDTIIIGGGGDKEKIEERIEKLKEHRAVEKTEMFKKKIERRIASLNAGIGMIKVGAKTDIERSYLRLKVEDAIYASKAAMEEGVVAGGGLALKRIAEKMPDNILTEVLKAPYNQIQENAGGNLKIDKDVIDPVKVTRIALENACSLAGILITTESAIAWNRGDIEKQLEDIGFLNKNE